MRAMVRSGVRVQGECRSEGGIDGDGKNEIMTNMML